MLARLLILAMLSGAVAVVAAVGLGLPVWSLLLIYSLVGSATLVVGGALAASGASGRPEKPGYGAAQVEPVHMPLRR